MIVARAALEFVLDAKLAALGNKIGSGAPARRHLPFLATIRVRVKYLQLGFDLQRLPGPRLSLRCRQWRRKEIDDAI